MNSIWRSLWRLAVLLLLSALALQLYFFARVALMIVVDPQSTTFQRSEIWRLATEQHEVLWSQDWVAYEQIGDRNAGGEKHTIHYAALLAPNGRSRLGHSRQERTGLGRTWGRGGTRCHCEQDCDVARTDG